MWHIFGKPAERKRGKFNSTAHSWKKDQLKRLPDGGYRVKKGNGLVIYQNSLRKPHRVGAPAMEWPDGSEAWYQNGLMHRVDGPAQKTAFGELRWYQNGKLFRENRLPTSEGPGLLKSWSELGVNHRFEGPALITRKGEEVWIVFGLRAGQGFSEECAQACGLDTSYETLFELCNHEDPVVSALAAHNPWAGDDAKVLFSLSPHTEDLRIRRNRLLEIDRNSKEIPADWV